jgi:hypothetical protein
LTVLVMANISFCILLTGSFHTRQCGISPMEL